MVRKLGNKRPWKAPLRVVHFHETFGRLSENWIGNQITCLDGRVVCMYSMDGGVGMVLARNEDDAARIKTLALHGMSKDAWKRFSDEGYKHYFVTECGFKYNMMDPQAAIGIHQLRRIESYWQRRKEIWRRYNEAFADLPVILPAEPEAHSRHALHLYTILIDPDCCAVSRDAFLNAMTRQNIGVGVHYFSIPEHPYYQNAFGWRAGDYPNAMKIGRQTVSLPISARLTDGDVCAVIESVRSCFE